MTTTTGAVEFDPEACLELRPVGQVRAERGVEARRADDVDGGGILAHRSNATSVLRAADEVEVARAS